MKKIKNVIEFRVYCLSYEFTTLPNRQLKIFYDKPMFWKYVSSEKDLKTTLRLKEDLEKGKHSITQNGKCGDDIKVKVIRKEYQVITITEDIAEEELDLEVL